MEKTEMIERLRERMRQVTPLPDEEDFATSDETLSRYLKAFEWKYADAEAGLLQTVEYRREHQPLRQGCSWCQEHPGFHSMRQVGHDESGRPVVYASFGQATARKNSAEDSVDHVTYLIENAKATMASGVSTWVFIIDCTGMSINVCRPKMGLRVASLLSSHYPERLGMVICVNHNPIFHALWKAMKAFLAPTTVAKMRLLRSESKIKQTFSTFFSDELSGWLWEEICLNKAKPLSDSQRHFWSPPPPSCDGSVDSTYVHDPRGCPSYVRDYVESFDASQARFVPGQKKVHLPHPNIVQPPNESNSCSSLGDASNGEGSEVDDVGLLKRTNGGNGSEGEADNELNAEAELRVTGSDLEDGSDFEDALEDIGDRRSSNGGGASPEHKKTDNGLTNGKVR